MDYLLVASKLLLDLYFPCLLFIINLSLRTGKFPEQLKTAKLIPLHKGGCKKEIQNWRLISILHLFSKLFEKLVESRLYTFLRNNELLKETQFSIRKGRSTTHALQHLVDFVNNVFERGDIPMSILIEVRKRPIL